MLDGVAAQEVDQPLAHAEPLDQIPRTVARAIEQLRRAVGRTRQWVDVPAGDVQPFRWDVKAARELAPGTGRRAEKARQPFGLFLEQVLDEPVP